MEDLYTGVWDDSAEQAIELDGGMVSFEDLTHLAIRTIPELQDADQLDDGELHRVASVNTFS